MGQGMLAWQGNRVTDLFTNKDGLKFMELLEEGFSSLQSGASNQVLPKNVT
jgi:hypothetical protein